MQRGEFVENFSWDDPNFAELKIPPFDTLNEDQRIALLDDEVSTGAIYHNKFITWLFFIFSTQSCIYTKIDDFMFFFYYDVTG